MGKIGTNITRSLEERAEDLLEYLYRSWRQGIRISSEQYAVTKGVSKRETKMLITKLSDKGYVIEVKKTGELQLTELGKMEGMECLERHEKLTQFFQVVSGMEQESAQEDACRIEHVISQRALEGIDNFLKYGDVYDRKYKGMDLYHNYGEGTFEMLMGIYQLERRNPRLLAPVDEKFEPVVKLISSKGISWFELKLIDNADVGILWYRRNDEWIKAQRENHFFLLPSDIFVYTTNVMSPITEADTVIAFTEFDQVPVTIDCCELNIHVW